jgi:TP901 family phage tail tape measure protein
MSRDLNTRLVIGGDASGASRALTGLEGQMNALQRAGGRLQAMGAGMKDFGQGALIAGGVAGAALVPLIGNFAKAENAVSGMKVAFMTAAGGIDGAFDKIQNQAAALGNELPGTTADFMQMARALKEQGLAGQTIADGALKATAHMRVLMNIADPERAAEFSGIFKNSLKIEDADFVALTDVIQRAKFAFGLDPQQFAGGIKYVGPALEDLGLKGLESSKKLMTIFGALRQNGIEGEMAGTGLRAAFDAMPKIAEKLKADPEMARTLKAAGVELQFYKDGKFAGLENMIVQMEQLNKLSPEKKTKAMSDLFGDSGGTVMKVLGSLGAEGYNKAVDAMAAQASAAARTEEILKTLENRWASAMGNIETSLGKIGGLFGDELKQGADAIGDMAAKVGDFAEANKGWVKYVGYGAAGFAAIAVTAGALALTIGTISTVTGQLSKGAGFVGSLFGRKPKPGEAVSPTALGAGLNVTPVRVMNWGDAGALGKGALSPANGNAANQFDPKKTPAPANSNTPHAPANMPGALEVDPKKPSLMRRAAGGMGRAGRVGGMALLGLAGSGLVSEAMAAGTDAAPVDALAGGAMDAAGLMQSLSAVAGGGKLAGRLGGAGALLGKAARPLGMVMDVFNFGSAVADGNTEAAGTAAGSLGGGLAGAMAGAAIGSIVPVIGTAIGGLIGGIAGSMAGEAGGGWLGRQASTLFGGGQPEDKKPEEKKGGWFSSLFGSGKAPDLSLPKTPALTEIVSREGIRPGPGIGAAQVTAPISITVNANGASPEVAAQVAKAVQDQSADIVRMITDHFERQRRVAM